MITVGNITGQYQVDIADSTSIRALFQAVGTVDAIVSTAGRVHFGTLTEMTEDQFKIGIQHKLLGQINLAMIGHAFVSDGGSITLTGGILDRNPIRYGVNATTVNCALNGFTVAAATELPRGIRINTVSATVLTESMPDYGPYFIGFEPAPAARVALAYARSVDGVQTGPVYKVW